MTDIQSTETVDTLPPVLDPASGSRMFYFDKADERVLFGDIRRETHVLCDGRALEVNPDEIMDFRDLPYPDASFRVVVFDPPHLLKVGEKGWMFKKYGRLDNHLAGRSSGRVRRVLPRTRRRGRADLQVERGPDPGQPDPRTDTPQAARRTPPRRQVLRHPLDHLPQGGRYLLSVRSAVMTGTCGCGATWGGTKTEHCAACHCTFTGTYSGDMHRVGRHDQATGPDRRRCLSVEEMTALGMAQNKFGVWMSPGREAETARLSISA